MRKIFLSLVALTASVFAANANSIQCINTTGCNIMISTQGGYIFLGPSGSATAMAFYSSPDNLAGLSTNGGTFVAAKVINDAVNPVTGPWTGEQVNVNTNPTNPAIPSSATSVNGQPCNSGNPFTATWIVSSTGNITLMITP